MATPQPQPILTPEERLAAEERARYNRYQRNLALVGIIACPTIILLPPRKLDLYTFSLGIGFYLSADHLAQSYNGRPLLQQFSFPSFSSPIRELPTEKARETARLIKEKEEREALDRARREGVEGLGRGEEKKSLLQRVWMGDEKEGWKERRIEEERKALEEGKSYTDLILEQIWDVWNWDKRRSSENDKGDGSKKD
ncbi:hypothetical protein N0V90_001151 [Kalmusia sp. IMI 367209]|nr:hypothetical protein N0V90_001151 [Kalmusia sp. IMI 367209]